MLCFLHNYCDVRPLHTLWDLPRICHVLFDGFFYLLLNLWTNTSCVFVFQTLVKNIVLSFSMQKQVKKEKKILDLLKKNETFYTVLVYVFSLVSSLLQLIKHCWPAYMYFLPLKLTQGLISVYFCLKDRVFFLHLNIMLTTVSSGKRCVSLQLFSINRNTKTKGHANVK